MKQYQVRASDLTTVVYYGGTCYERTDATDVAALKWFKLLRGYEKFDGLVFGIADFELDSEADKARLDWMESHRLASGRFGFVEEGQTIRQFLDEMRDAPKTTFTVIETEKPNVPISEINH